MIRDEKCYVPFVLSWLFFSETKSIRQGERKEYGGVRGRGKALGLGEQTLNLTPRTPAVIPVCFEKLPNPCIRGFHSPPN